jgi:hypothetical protein
MVPPVGRQHADREGGRHEERPPERHGRRREAHAPEGAQAQANEQLSRDSCRALNDLRCNVPHGMLQVTLLVSELRCCFQSERAFRVQGYAHRAAK